MTFDLTRPWYAPDFDGERPVSAQWESTQFAANDPTYPCEVTRKRRERLYRRPR